MKTTTSNNLVTAIALLLALPCAWFILANILNEAGNPALYNSTESIMNNMGEVLPNVLILFGPMIALLMCLFQVIRLRLHFTTEDFHLNLTVHKRWFPLLVVLFTITLLGVLAFYGYVENCNCYH